MNKRKIIKWASLCCCRWESGVWYIISTTWWAQLGWPNASCNWPHGVLKFGFASWATGLSLVLFILSSETDQTEGHWQWPVSYPIDLLKKWPKIRLTHDPYVWPVIKTCKLYHTSNTIPHCTWKLTVVLNIWQFWKTMGKIITRSYTLPFNLNCSRLLGDPVGYFNAYEYLHGSRVNVHRPRDNLKRPIRPVDPLPALQTPGTKSAYCRLRRGRPTVPLSIHHEATARRQFIRQSSK